MEKNKYIDPMITGCICTAEIKDEDIVQYQVRDKIHKTGTGEHDFEVIEEVFEQSRINRNEFIQSFASDVGIENIIKKVKISGDNTLLMQTAELKHDVDLRNLPQNKMQFDDAIEKGKEAAKTLGIAMSEEALKEYLDKKIAESIAAKQEGGAQ